MPKFGQIPYFSTPFRNPAPESGRSPGAAFRTLRLPRDMGCRSCG
ncbi:hypothetical protein GDI3299 [Gluconacetobacter diazotrophicus PA1 5]|uniref:Uncharacterized protein n=1 Tax=Gluconacetobacter diazotrophicus (strain ATCC 49037 / DSM 5601 / CCUG 37298 / CIP 103539 / LMG 7603 / PAl5) TaxID=272568 RepID=A9H1E1_GLUDA|nr:hypothetical protein GDI3299 [Gluconacetobacter diazotrophicus PA1 5]